MPGAARTIGQVLEQIRVEFPDISVSKLRYLEAEGLISPERDQPSGYRRFRQDDVDRLLFVLRAQRDRYLPLKVIREQLDALDRGEEPAATPEIPEATTAHAEPPARRTVPAVEVGPLLTRRQLLKASGLGEAVLIELERLRLIRLRRGTQLYGREALAIAVAAKRLGALGVDPRQLRVVQQAAAMEAALAEQALSPYQRRSGIPKEIVADVYRTILQAHNAFMHSQVNE